MFGSRATKGNSICRRENIFSISHELSSSFSVLLTELSAELDANWWQKLRYWFLLWKLCLIPWNNESSNVWFRLWSLWSLWISTEINRCWLSSIFRLLECRWKYFDFHRIFQLIVSNRCFPLLMLICHRFCGNQSEKDSTWSISNAEW